MNTAQRRQKVDSWISNNKYFSYLSVFKTGWFWNKKPGCEGKKDFDVLKNHKLFTSFDVYTYKTSVDIYEYSLKII